MEVKSLKGFFKTSAHLTSGFCLILLLQTFQFLHSCTKKESSVFSNENICYYFIITLLIFTELGKKKSSLKMPANPTFSYADIQKFSAVSITIPQIFWIHPPAVKFYLLFYLFWIFRRKIIWVGGSLFVSKRMTKTCYSKASVPVPSLKVIFFQSALAEKTFYPLSFDTLQAATGSCPWDSRYLLRNPRGKGNTHLCFQSSCLWLGMYWIKCNKSLV